VITLAEEVETELAENVVPTGLPPHPLKYKEISATIMGFRLFILHLHFLNKGKNGNTIKQNNLFVAGWHDSYLSPFSFASPTFTGFALKNFIASTTV
jgi:hypothetical protein